MKATALIDLPNLPLIPTHDPGSLNISKILRRAICKMR